MPSVYGLRFVAAIKFCSVLLCSGYRSIVVVVLPKMTDPWFSIKCILKICGKLWQFEICCGHII